MGPLARLAVVLLSLASAAACVKTQAKTPAPPPPLSTPIPPFRMVVPVSLDVPPPPTAPEPATEPPVAAAARPNPPPVRSTAPPPPTQPPPTTPDPEPATAVLQPPSNPGELEKRARDLVAEAQRHVQSVAVDTLTTDARDQWTNAQRFVRQAKDALTARNYLYATQLADKANQIARLLLKR